MFLLIFFRNFSEEISKSGKKNSAVFPKLCSKCPEERFQDKHVSFRKNCVFPFILDFETELIRIFVSNFSQRVFSEFHVSVGTFQSKNCNFLNQNLLFTVSEGYENKIHLLVEKIGQNCRNWILQGQKNIFRQIIFLGKNLFSYQLRTLMEKMRFADKPFGQVC